MTTRVTLLSCPFGVSRALGFFNAQRSISSHHTAKRGARVGRSCVCCPLHVVSAACSFLHALTVKPKLFAPPLGPPPNNPLKPNVSEWTRSPNPTKFHSPPEVGLDIFNRLGCLLKLLRVQVRGQFRGFLYIRIPSSYGGLSEV